MDFNNYESIVLSLIFIISENALLSGRCKGKEGTGVKLAN